jgi:hypothetical protein
MIVSDGPAAPTRRRTPIGTLLCWVAVGPTAAWAAVRLSGLDRGPLVQALAFTPYVAGWSVLALGLSVALRRRWPAAVAALAAVALLGVVAPRALAAPQPTATGPTIRLLTANLLAGSPLAPPILHFLSPYKRQRPHVVDTKCKIAEMGWGAGSAVGQTGAGARP